MHKFLGASAHRLRRSHNVLEATLMGFVHKADTCPFVSDIESKKAPELVQMLHMLHGAITVISHLAVYCTLKGGPTLG